MARRSGTEPRARTFHVVIAVWGEEYRDLFLGFCVPNQLMPGNLDALPPGSRYRVFTSEADAGVLKSSPALRRVAELMPVDVSIVPQLAGASTAKFRREVACHRRALTDARDSAAALIFVCPDHFLSEGTFAAVVRRHEAGNRAVVCPGMRVDRDAFIATLSARGRSGGIPPRELVSVALGHLHPFARVHMIDGGQALRRPVAVYWRVPGEGLLARCFYLTPLMVDPLRRDVLPDETIDGHYVRRACPLRDEIHVVTDSDELVVFEMSQTDAIVPSDPPGRISSWRAAAMMSRCDSHQQSYWMMPIRLHVRDIGEGWRPVEEQSARFARRVGTLCRARRLFKLRYVMWLVRHGSLTGRIWLRRTTRPYSAALRRSAVLVTHAAARTLQQFRKRAVRVTRKVRGRTRRSVALLTHRH